jgi:FkbM family methyltransferase
MITVPLAQTAKSVIAIESNTFIYNILCGNLAWNSLQNVRALNCAAAHASGTMGYCCGWEFNGVQNYGSSHVSSQPGVVDECGRKMDRPIATVAIDDLVFTYPGITPTLIKIDVEGMELPVLTGAINTIERYRPYLSVEYLGDKAGIVGFLSQLGYRWRLLRTPVFNGENFAGVTENCLMVDGKHIFSHNLLCWPKDGVEPKSQWLCDLEEVENV